MGEGVKGDLCWAWSLSRGSMNTLIYSISTGNGYLLVMLTNIGSHRTKVIRIYIILSWLGVSCFLKIEALLFPGEHKRLGALDVCPFIPVQGVTMDDCVQCAKVFGESAAIELGIPGISKFL